ncbi:hypothetical protein [Xanthobacter flavus]|uniref:hypothetical protein n=1 Tax=Xanthobacter flavus TaxID=281 RepID=UPI001AE37201|nr:hypothetical protein [Xanthobacter flavus]MBP2147912.1 hypothetical protein [Xanthobacter flavus]
MRAALLLLIALALVGCASQGNGLIGSGGGVSRGSYVDIAPDGTRRVAHVSP